MPLADICTLASSSQVKGLQPALDPPSLPANVTAKGLQAGWYSAAVQLYSKNARMPFQPLNTACGDVLLYLYKIRSKSFQL